MATIIQAFPTGRSVLKKNGHKLGYPPVLDKFKYHITNDGKKTPDYWPSSFLTKTRRRQNKTRSGDVRGQNGSKKHGTHHNFPLINGNFGVCQPFSDRPKYRHEQITSMGHHQQGITYENQSNMRELCMCICVFEHNSDSSLMSLTGRG